MKKLSSKVLTLFLMAALFVTTARTAFAEDFMIGFYYAPPSDYTNATQYDLISDANINEVFNVNAFDSTIDTVAKNITAMDLSSQRGLKYHVSDARVRNVDSATNAEIDAFVNDYKNHSALKGLYIRDEPSASRWEGYARAYNRYLYDKPDIVPYANLLGSYSNSDLETFPVVETAQTEVGNGTFVQSNQLLRQSFKTSATTSYIQSIELKIDYNTWSPAENLTLTLWNADKTVWLAKRTLNATNNGYYPSFELMANVSPNTTYQWELTHDGGGNNTVGWVVGSTADVYPDGIAYVNNSGQSWDFYFRVFSGYTKAKTTLIEQNQGYTVDTSVTSGRPLGQSFKTTAFTTNIDSIELHLDSTSWSPGEALTLKLWDSPSKTTLIASNALQSTNNIDYPRFKLNANVSANTTYYWEITHNGGGDNLIGPVYYTNYDSYTDGNLYSNGTSAPNSDFYFRIYGKDRLKMPLLASQTLQGTGYNVTSTNSLGQTFKTPLNSTYINMIQLMVDSSSWGAGEALTLKLWDSSSKTTLIASSTLTATNNGDYPQFQLASNVSANTSYYWELTHNGGGNNSVGWVWNSNTNNYADGSAYQNGLVLNNDFVFRVYGSPAIKDKIVMNSTFGDGDFVSTSNAVGQTIKTPADLDRNLYSVELYVDPSTWTTGETMTLTVYDSVSKKEVFAKDSISDKSNNGWFPRFNMNGFLKPNTTYYLELTHNGGGNNSIYVVHSPLKTYIDGSGYKNGTAQTWDLYFRCIFSSDYQDYLDEWVDTIGPSSLKNISNDFYPFSTLGDLTDSYFLNLELLRDKGLKTNISTRGYLQSVGIANYMTRPNENQMRWNVFTSLAYGLKGLSWFTWWTPTNIPEFSDAIINRTGNKTDLYTPVQTLNAQIKNLGPTLMGLTSQDIFHSVSSLNTGTRSVPTDFFWKTNNSSDDVIISYFINSSNRKYIMAVNKSYTSTVTFTFNINPKPSTVTEVSKTTGLEVSTNYNSSTGVISAQFAPGEGKLYALPSGY
ncbi:hypothetical protein Back11_48750 [Paenibacillus baekrokdamisoli]|uniref:Uncharacterized protein n=1 Tax=Paenibacillus baekrokdamisoli TaxID=1712516 RepID=A0A3G9IXC1_9BACL|nr:hypothetical protein [Paenibacillus baekrokdamisoli]MBB3068699.1 hypothetical protein [Paenibacillus baekrokdamisoli]BBH23530.1 hypothetical protein Back11_48750 [Paenibacillus baekrokdamisoli]